MYSVSVNVHNFYKLLVSQEDDRAKRAYWWVTHMHALAVSLFFWFSEITTQTLSLVLLAFLFDILDIYLFLMP